MLSSVLNATQVPHIARTGMKTTTEYIELVEEAFEAMNLSISVVRPV
jgi:hydroxymethylpyrimidine/phosphomethylpyrimidine kinase